MPTNIEIKARVRDPASLAARVEAISDGPGEVLVQRDTFFRSPRGRLKLREIAGGRSELIWYERSDVAGTKRSDYLVTPVADGAGLRGVLAESLGVTAVVEKTRRLFLAGQTRIHLDAVKDLGDFLELEVVLRREQSESEGHAIAAELMRRLGVDEVDLLECAYADMLPRGE